MKFIKQLSEDEFIVKMELSDGNDRKSIILAHDYLQFNGRDWYCTNFSGLNTPWGSGNVICIATHIQIPIRMAQDMLENVLTKDRKYLEENHLKCSDGSSKYLDVNGANYRYTTDDGIKMIAIFSRDQEKYIHIPLDLYKTIKEAE